MVRKVNVKKTGLKFKTIESDTAAALAKAKTTSKVQDDKDQFIERTKKHIKMVCDYGKKIGKDFSNHDADKLTILADAYKSYSKPNKTEDEIRELDKATLQHIVSNSHHPEYWTNQDLRNFTRENPTPTGPINATSMSDDAIAEMCCDWCAMSREFGNSPHDWVETTIGKRWIFTDKQKETILNLIDFLWSGK